MMVMYSWGELPRHITAAHGNVTAKFKDIRNSGRNPFTLHFVLLKTSQQYNFYVICFNYGLTAASILLRRKVAFAHSTVKTSPFPGHRLINFTSSTGKRVKRFWSGGEFLTTCILLENVNSTNLFQEFYCLTAYNCHCELLFPLVSKC